MVKNWAPLAAARASSRYSMGKLSPLFSISTAYFSFMVCSCSIFTKRQNRKKKGMSRKNNITSIGAQSKIILYVWDRCVHSQKMLEDLAQLSDVTQERIEIVDIVDAIEDESYPPPMTCTPCLYVTDASSDGQRPVPLVINGRKSILLFCDLRAADTLHQMMDDSEAQGADQIASIFEKTAVRERHENVTNLGEHRNFDFVVDDSTATRAHNSGKRVGLFNSMIDDPTTAQDPRMTRKVGDALSDLMKSRGYST
jgi:hypothetical protein